MSQWLKNWKTSTQQSTKPKSKARKAIKDSKLVNTLVICGPEGVGKTTSVYTCANEQGFKVTEINSSTKRNGARIIELFGEATQSHQIDKWQAVTEDKSESPVVKEDTDLDTIILFEEADAIFEDEAGFFKAIYNLIHNTKRPIILTCNGLTPELEKLLSEDSVLLLQYNQPSLQDLLIRLLVVCFVEGALVDIDDMKQLILLFACDIRKLLHACQFWIQGHANNPESEQKLQHQTPLPILKVTDKLMPLAQSAEHPLLKTNAHEDIRQQLASLSFERDILSLQDAGLLAEPKSETVDSTAYHCDTIKEQIAVLQNQLLGPTVFMQTKVIALDYVPVLRDICANEQSRQQANTKRRFLHHLGRCGLGSEFLTEFAKSTFSPKQTN